MRNARCIRNDPKSAFGFCILSVNPLPWWRSKESLAALDPPDTGFLYPFGDFETTLTPRPRVRAIEAIAAMRVSTGGTKERIVNSAIEVIGYIQ